MDGAFVVEEGNQQRFDLIFADDFYFFLFIYFFCREEIGENHAIDCRFDT